MLKYKGMWLTQGKERKFCYKEWKKGALQNASCLSSTEKKSLNFSRQMTERLSVSMAKSSFPSSSSCSALDNQGLDKQVSQGKKKKGETLYICHWDQKYIPASRSCDEGSEEGV